MGRKKFFIVSTFFIFLLLVFCFVFAEQNSITLPKGTTIEKLGQGYFKFKLPDGRIVEVKNLDSKSGIMGYVAVIDPEPPHKPVVSSTRAKFIAERIKTVNVPSGTEYVMIDDDIVWLKRGIIPKSNYVMIDDDIVWLPATIQFGEETMGVKGLSPQPDPPGKLRK